MQSKKRETQFAHSDIM